MEEKIVVCLKCGSKLCYESKIGELTSWMCTSCGFQTNNYMQHNSEEHLNAKSTLPELYRDLEFIDLENKVWYPVTLNFPERGMVFIQGSSKNNWNWVGVLATKVTEEEKPKFKKKGTENEYYTHKMDMTTSKAFGKDEFIGACDYIGMFNE
jgi:DNA-directed RNA polymerase subunit RPC12/RpoP